MRTLLIVLALCLPCVAQTIGPTPGLPQASGDMTCTAAGVCTFKRQTTTVGALPTCNAAARGQMYIVTDSLLPAAIATVAAGGAVVVGVTCNGTNWIVQ